MQYLFKFLPLACMTVLAGCEQQLTVPPNNAEPRTVVYSELVAGSKPEVRIGKSKPVAPGINNRFEVVDNATIQLMGKNGQILETLSYTPDSNNTMSVYTGNLILDAAKNYKVQVVVPEMKLVSATAWIPAPFEIMLKDTFRTLLNGRPVLRMSVTIHSNPGVRQYLVMEALKQSVMLDTSFTYQGMYYRKSQYPLLYEQTKNQSDVSFRKDSIFMEDYLRIPCYTQDENADNNQIGGLNENYNHIFFTQTGKPLTTNLYINATALSSNPAEAKTPVGRVLVNIKSVSKEYYDFLMTYEKIKRNPGLNSLVQAIQLRCNTTGGLGIIGGCYKKVFYLYYDKL